MVYKWSLILSSTTPTTMSIVPDNPISIPKIPPVITVGSDWSNWVVTLVGTYPYLPVTNCIPNDSVDQVSIPTNCELHT